MLALLWLPPNSFCAAEKERIEAQVKAAEAAAQFKLDEELRKKREREREAARLALHMVVAACPVTIQRVS